MRALIVNADDFGRSPGINAGVIEAHEQGIVTSAGLMVRWPAAAEAAAYARGRPQLSLGLHADLGEWIHEDDRWITVYETAPFEDRAAVEAEIRSQLAAFRALVGADPTHIDTHQHLHRPEGSARAALRAIAEELGVPSRDLRGDVRYCGDFYGQGGRGQPHPGAISPENLIALIRALPPGVTEISCHPARGDDSGSTYRRERELEVETLCDPRVKAVIAEEGVELCSFADVAAGTPPA